MAVEAKVVARWDGPVDYAVGWKLDKLRNLLSESIDKNFANATGRLAESFTIRVVDRFSIAIASSHPGAAAQEYGANIPERFPVNASVMRFQVGGDEVYARRAKAFKLPAKRYIQEAVDDWVKHFLGVKWVKEKP